MRGEIRLKATWHRFNAAEVIRWNRGFVWHAKVRMKGLPVSGFDRLIDGQGAMRWSLLGIVPIVMASGLDVSQSAVDRMLTEAVWLPSVLLDPSVTWTEQDATHVGADVTLGEQRGHLELSLDEEGRIRSVSTLRWGNPEGKAYRELPFGGMAEEERRFDGFTIPSKLRIGWYFGGDRFESEGEFFRCTIDEAVYR
jgi:hypothetical protein